MTQPADDLRLRHATSADGTQIACFERGAGPHLVCLHGALLDHNGWNALGPQLRDHFTVHAIDRRGRGQSGDAPSYAIERELEDLAAVLGHAGGPACVFGHSSGGILALLAAEQGLPIQRLVLYEPPLIVAGQRSPYPPHLTDRLLLQSVVDPDTAVRTFLREGPLWSEAEIERLASEPARWAVLLRMARTTAYDAAIVGGYRFDPARLAAIELPALVLTGGASPAWYRAAASSLAASLPNAELKVLPDLTHMAIYQAPEAVAAEVIRFLS
jgi:pimeloyl-ACP methyl ester carboxylesterase